MVDQWSYYKDGLEVYRDIDALSASGVPVYGERGPEGGYILLDGYRTTLTGLTADEMRAIDRAAIDGCGIPGIVLLGLPAYWYWQKGRGQARPTD